jgi:hypothetical protein
MPPLAHTLAETGPLWAKELGPITERVARQLFEAKSLSKPKSSFPKVLRSNGKPLPTPLTEGNRSAGRGPYRRKSRPNIVEEIH